MTFESPAMYVFLCFSFILLGSSSLYRIKQYVFLLLNIIFIFLFIAHPRLPSIVILLLWVTSHFLVLKLMLHVRAKRLVFILWLIINLVWFLVSKEYTWITRIFFMGHMYVWWSVLGYSFILFRQIHLSVNVCDGMITDIEFLDYFNYNLAFWTFLAGPIQRYDDFIGQWRLLETTKVNDHERIKGLNRMLWGLIKVVAIAPFFEQYADIKTFTALPNAVNFIILLMSFPLYLYLNFSGYCDVVIGFARSVGFKIPENFRSPFVARNIIDFWTRWHITLSEFFRDYLYFPMLMFSSRYFNALASSVAATFISFFLMGIWHGNSLRFAVFGILHGAGVGAALLYTEFLKKVLSKEKLKAYKNNKIIHIIAVILCQSYVMATFLVFKYPMKDLHQLLDALKGH